MPLTIIVVSVRRDMMTMSETKTNDTMKKTENTMDDASECVSARTCSAHAHRRTRKPATSARGGPSPQHVLLKRPPLRSPYHALLLGSPSSPFARRWQQMMRTRLGIDKTKSWADWAEEEEEAAELTKTLEAATAEQFKPRLLLGVRLRGGAVESELGHESGEDSGGEGEKGGGEAAWQRQRRGRHAGRGRGTPMVGRRRQTRGDRAGTRGGLSQGLGEAVGYLRVAKRPQSR